MSDEEFIIDKRNFYIEMIESDCFKRIYDSTIQEIRRTLDRKYKNLNYEKLAGGGEFECFQCVLI